MTSPRRIRFAVAAHAVTDGPAWMATARRTEELGYDTLLLPDHTNPQLAPLVGLLAAALATTTLRVGTQVLCNDLRNPVIAAKEVASVDLLSGGRFDWGMGAGWLPSDYHNSGVRLDPPGVRVDRLIESVGLMRSLLAGEAVDHAGTYYEARDLVGSPLPVQRPHPPLLIGGARQRLLRFGGAEADIVSIAPSWDSRQVGPYPPMMTVDEAVDNQIRWAREGAESAGRDFGEVELSVTVMPATVTDDAASVFESAGAMHGLTTAQARRAPFILAGTVAEICETVLERRERWGLSYWVVPVESLEAMAPVVASLSGT